MSVTALCLGTAQFGLAYGVTNATGQVDRAEVQRLLARANGSSVAWLDTAQAYGEAEQVLGACLPPHHGFGLISKLPAQPCEPFSAAHAEQWEANFQRSLIRLGATRLDAFLLHNAADLLRPDAAWLLEWLLSLRQRGLVQRLGVSIYSGQALEGLPLEQLQLVQLPLSLYDQRPLRDGTLAQLRQLGIAVHARSLFLQGLLLTPASQWPAWMDPGLRRHHAHLEAWALERNTTTHTLALAFAQQCQALEAAVIGVTSSAELEQLLRGWEQAGTGPGIADPSSWAWPEGDSLDPRCWPR